MYSRLSQIASTILVTVASALVAAQCPKLEYPQKQSFIDSQYAKQIQLARQATLEIFDHGLIGNSDSAINQKIGRPPGLSVAVAVDGQLVWAEGFGFADLEQCVPVTPKTKFRIGSTSKPLTAAGAAWLHEQGRLDWDAPIQKYVPSFPDKGSAITVRQLLGHLGGIRDYNAKESATLDRDVYHSVNESLQRFKDDPLIAPPGTKWHYTTYGYVLASAAMEGASGQDFLSFMHDRVLAPLKLLDTVPDESDKIIPDRAHWYVHVADGSFRNAPYEDLSYKWAGGGFLSTAEDLVMFGSAMLKPGFLKQETLALIFSRQTTASGNTTKYGLGWEIPNVEGERCFEHSGGVAGSSSYLVLYPDQHVVIAWLQNSNDFRDWPIVNVAKPFFTKQN